ncbi:MAG TPA: AsmA-like C-terminal region-containing protein [Verrucomicrobiae bacterium]|nr:AsmA-like C-terminal region-containing protein [Verrucomicrobiae bacterium]
MRFHSGFWRKCRIGFRWFRIATLLAVLALVCAGVWFNRLGLPDFLKRPLVEKLRARGVELEFTRLRLRFVRGLVAENVRLGHAATPDSPTISLAEVQLRLDYRALLHRRLQINSLVLREGKLVWPLTPTNALVLNRIQTDLRFQTNDTWSLDHFQAGFAGVKLSLTAEIAHAPELRHWEMFHGQGTGIQAAVRTQLQKISDTIERIHFEGAPQLSLVAHGDARDIHSFAIHLDANAPAVQTPWGGARDVQLAADLTAPAGASTNLDPAWAWWTNLQPYRLAWTMQLTRLESEKLKADSVAWGGLWQAPELAVTNLSAALGGGQLDAQARLNVATREFAFTSASCFDVHAVAALLTAKTRERLAEFSWTQPPSLRAGGTLLLPAWTNRQWDWRAEVQPTIRLAGELAFTNGTAFGAKIDSASTHFGYSNLVWQLPDLAITQAKTRLALAGGEDDATKNYRWHIRGTFDPESLRPFLTASNAVRGLGHFALTEPAALDFEARGRLYDYERIEATGSAALTNFAVHGQVADSVVSGFQYSNRVVEFFGPRLFRAGGTQTMSADRITLDFNTRRIWFVNGFSTADPEAVARAIGSKTGRTLEPYQFSEPPTVRVNGYAPLHNSDDADLSFDIIKGAPFRWLKFKTSFVTGTIHWQGQTLILTNVAAAFYGGSGKGSANFDFRAPHQGADYQFAVNVTNVNLRLLAADLLSPTNHLEGMLSGQLLVTHADSRDWQRGDGFGRADLRDGLLWDIPIFGVLSPVLNTVSPGLGNSRATEASARFFMTNGVIHSDSLEIRSTMMRLQYAGTVDLTEKVNARVTAQPLRDTWVVGPLVSTALWPVSKLFEFHVTGTLSNPKSEPVYVPKLLLMPLHPLRSFEELFPTGNFSTNSPSTLRSNAAPDGPAK